MSKLPFNQLSSKKCKTEGCDRRIKQEILNRRPSADLCYRCFCKAELKKGNKVVSGNAARKENRGGNIYRASSEAIRNGRRNSRTI
jgi:hypothetical protein